MYNIYTLNNITASGLDLLTKDCYQLTDDIATADAILLRSYKMHGMSLPANLKAIGRAGAGVNNIPVDICSKQGIAVFNSPGANANSVKELVLMSLFLSSRQIVQGINWASSLAYSEDGRKESTEDFTKRIEKGKSAFAGPEISGKTLGVVGLGAIGRMVANDAISLGMSVFGYDRFLSVESAWSLSRSIIRAINLDELLTNSDYITLHLPLNEQTRNLIDKSKLNLMRPGTRLFNFSRSGLVVNEDVKQALNENKLACYITDFPEKALMGQSKVICLPHLGASTPEAEDNCASMVVQQLMDYLECGNIKNSVNFPDCSMAPTGKNRLLVANLNVPSMVGQITRILSENRINIKDLLNKSKGDLAFNIIDIESDITERNLAEIRQIDGVTMVRLIRGE